MARLLEVKNSMLNAISRLAAIVGVALIAVAPAFAQDGPTAEDLTLHPGDTITWTPIGPHRVQFGGDDVTPFSEVETILESIEPELTANADDVAGAPIGTVVTATVRADAAEGAQFNFTCGVHPAVMVTVPFVVGTAMEGQEPRDVQIRSSGFAWVLEKDGGTVPLGAN